MRRAALPLVAIAALVASASACAPTASAPTAPPPATGGEETARTTATTARDEARFARALEPEEVVVRTVEDGTPHLRARFDAAGLEIAVAATPSRDPINVYLILAASGGPDEFRSCRAGLLVDGEILPLILLDQYQELGHEHFVSMVPLALLRRMSRAERVAARICDQEWRLHAHGRAVLGELVARFDEELLWSEQGSSSQSTPAEDAPPPDGPARR